MCFIYLFSIWCRDALHAVAAAAQENGAEDIDDQVNHGVQLLHHLTVTMLDRGHSRRFDIVGAVCRAIPEDSNNRSVERSDE